MSLFLGQKGNCSPTKAKLMETTSWLKVQGLEASEPAGVRGLGGVTGASKTLAVREEGGERWLYRLVL